MVLDTLTSHDHELTDLLELITKWLLLWDVHEVAFLIELIDLLVEHLENHELALGDLVSDHDVIKTAFIIAGPIEETLIVTVFLLHFIDLGEGLLFLGHSESRSD